MRAVAPVEPSAESASAEIGGREETWEEDALARMGGWPLVAGALIGMVVAAAVGAVAVNHMTGTRHAEQVVSPVVNPVPPERAENPRTESVAKDPQGEASAVTARADDVPASAPTEPINDSETDDASASLAGDREKPISTQATAGPLPESTAPGTGTNADAETATETSASEGDGSADESDPSADGVEGFAVTFRAEPGSVDRMRVRCHTLDPVDGIEEVFIDRAVKGPCRVEGFIGESKLSVSAVLKGPKSYTCFRDGSRICE